MCIIFFRYSNQVDCPYKFILASNRDQSSDRKAEPFQQFTEDQNVYAGRDVLSKGSWLGVNIKLGIVVGLTNLNPSDGGPKSRGDTVFHLLKTSTFESDCSQQKITKQLQQFIDHGQQYGRFNLVLYHAQNNITFYINNSDQKEPSKLQPNTSHGIACTVITNPIAKVSYCKAQLDKIVQNINLDSQQLINKLEGLLLSRQQFPKDFRGFQEQIFIQPYFNPKNQNQRRTKSSNIMLLNNQMRMTVREFTHLESTSSVTYHFQL